MGKKSSFKQLRKLAAELPEITVYARVGSVVGMDELQARKIKVAKDQYSATGKYKLVENKPVPLNHYQKMKDALQKYGAEGVRAYVRQVRKFDFERRLKAEAEKALEVEQPINIVSSESVDSRILEEGEYQIELSAPTFDEGEE